MSSDTGVIGLKKGVVKLYPHQKSWEENAVKVTVLLKELLGDICVDVQHIGSTAIKDICAKPIIDIAVAVNDFNDVYRYVDILAQHGIIYRKVEETGQLLFVMGNLAYDIKTHHIHIVIADSLNWHNYINFRDYLNAIPEKAKEYNDLKSELATEFSNNRKAYTAGKKELINKLLLEAEEWKTTYM